MSTDETKDAIDWVTDRLPESQDAEEPCNTYYLVYVEGWGAAKAMYMDNGWWKDYTARIVHNVLGWVEINEPKL